MAELNLKRAYWLDCLKMYTCFTQSAFLIRVPLMHNVDPLQTGDAGGYSRDSTKHESRASMHYTLTGEPQNHGCRVLIVEERVLFCAGNLYIPFQITKGFK